MNQPMVDKGKGPLSAFSPEPGMPQLTGKMGLDIDLAVLRCVFLLEKVRGIDKGQPLTVEEISGATGIEREKVAGMLTYLLQFGHFTLAPDGSISMLPRGGI